MCLTGTKLAKVVCSCAKALAKFDCGSKDTYSLEKMSFILLSIVKIWLFVA